MCVNKKRFFLKKLQKKKSFEISSFVIPAEVPGISSPICRAFEHCLEVWGIFESNWLRSTVLSKVSICSAGDFTHLCMQTFVTLSVVRKKLWLPDDLVTFTHLFSKLLKHGYELWLYLVCINCSFKWKDEKTASEFLLFLKGIFNAALYCHSILVFLTAPSSWDLTGLSLA